MTATVGTTPDTPSRTRSASVLAGLRLLVAAQFAVGGALKLAGAHVMVQMFADIGAGDWLRYLVGAAEVLGAIGLLVTRVSRLAAAGLAILMLGAAAARMTALGGAPVIEILLIAILVLMTRPLDSWRRRRRAEE